MAENKIDFIAHVMSVKKTKFQWVSFERQSSMNENETIFEYLTFELKDPIEKVTSSWVIPNPSNSEDKRSRSLVDVGFLNIEMDDLKKYNADFTPDVDSNGKVLDSGTYEGNLEIDFGRFSDKVWLTPVKMAKKARTKQEEKRQQQFNNTFGTATDIMNKLNEKKNEG